MFFFSVYVIDATCFDECLLFHVIAGRHCFFSKFVVTLRFYNRHIAVFFQTSILKEVRNLCYWRWCITNTNANGKFQKKLSYIIFTHTWKTFVADFFYDNVCYSLCFFNCSTRFFIKLFFFFWKTQNISENIFYIIL